MKVGGSLYLLQNGMDDSPMCGNEFPAKSADMLSTWKLNFAPKHPKVWSMLFWGQSEDPPTFMICGFKKEHMLNKIRNEWIMKACIVKLNIL